MSLPIRRLATLQRAVFLINSRLGLFTETNSRWHPFYRRYRAILPSSLGRFHSRALEYSSRIPVSVCGTGDIMINCINFPETPSIQSPSAVASGSLVPYSTLDRDIHHPTELHVFVNIQLKHHYAGIGLLTYCASTTPYGLALAPD